MAGYPEMHQHSGAVAGYPMLRASNADTDHVSRRVLGGLEQAAEKLGVTLTVISGYRDPGYSAAHGGYSTDPHSRGVAADVYVGSMTIGEYCRSKGLDPVAFLAGFGLESGDQPGFYRGNTDPEHVQIPGSGVNKGIVDYGDGQAGPGGGSAGGQSVGPLPAGAGTGSGSGSAQDVSLLGSIGGAITGAAGDVFGGLFGGIWHGLQSAGNAIVGIMDALLFFVHFVTSPDNWLRLVEFLAGVGLIVIALSIYLKVFTGSSSMPAPAKIPPIPVPE